MLRLLYAILLGLVGAALVHIVVLVLVPSFSSNDAWTRLAAQANLYHAIPFTAETGGDPVAKSVDPLFRAAACRFDLGEGFVHLKTDGRVPFWSVSIYDRSGENLYSLNDRVALKRNLDIVVITPADLIELKKNLPEELSGSVFVETEIGEAIAVVRAFVPNDTWLPTVASFLGGLSCSPETL
jgi:uncharacterized membrane protein